MLFSIIYELAVSKAGSTTQSTNNVGIKGKRNVVNKKPAVTKKKTVSTNKTNTSDNKDQENITVQNPKIKPLHAPHEHPTMAKAQKVWKDPINKSLPPSVLKKVNTVDDAQQQAKTVRVVGTKGVDPNKNTNNVVRQNNNSNNTSTVKPNVAKPASFNPVKSWGPI